MEKTTIAVIGRISKLKAMVALIEGQIRSSYSRKVTKFPRARDKLQIRLPVKALLLGIARENTFLGVGVFVPEEDNQSDASVALSDYLTRRGVFHRAWKPAQKNLSWLFLLGVGC